MSKHRLTVSFVEALSGFVWSDSDAKLFRKISDERYISFRRMRCWRSAEFSADQEVSEKFRTLVGGGAKSLQTLPRHAGNLSSMWRESLRYMRRARFCARIGDRSIVDPLAIGPAWRDRLTSAHGPVLGHLAGNAINVSPPLANVAPTLMPEAWPRQCSGNAPETCSGM